MKSPLESVRKDRVLRPIRAVIYGPPKVGKTTFASHARDAVILGSEDGADALEVAKFPAPRAWSDVLAAVRALTDEDHSYRCLVLDTLDWLEPLLWAHVCEQAKKPDIEAFGYGKGYAAALDGWRVLISSLERMRAARGVSIIALAHAHVRTFQNPEGADFDRWEMKLHKAASGLWAEWPDVVGFANFELIVRPKDNTPAATGRRLLYTQPSPSFGAGSRYQMPSPMALDWGTFAGAVVADFERKDR